FGEAETLAEQLTDSDGKPHAMREEYRKAFSQAHYQLATQELAHYALWAAGLLGLVLCIVAIASGSWRAQRQIRIWLGRRWVFAAGKCNYVIEISSMPESNRIYLRPVEGDARSNVLVTDVSSNAWPPPEAGIDVIKRNLEPATLIRI